MKSWSKAIRVEIVKKLFKLYFKPWTAETQKVWILKNRRWIPWPAHLLKHHEKTSFTCFQVTYQVTKDPFEQVTLVCLWCNSLQIDTTKGKTLSYWKPPWNFTSRLQWFIGFNNFYHCFIDQFSWVAWPLHEMTKKDTKFDWTPACHSAFPKLKVSFTSAPILKIADLNHLSS